MSGDLANVVRICTIGIGKNERIRIGRKRIGIFIFCEHGEHGVGISFVVVVEFSEEHLSTQEEMFL